MNVQSFGATDVGKLRKHNEDTFQIVSESGVYLVCDGVGGHAAGEVASGLTADAMARFLVREHQQLQAIAQGIGRDPGAIKQINERLRAGIAAANAEVYARAQSDEGTKGMGTTLAMVLMLGRYAFCVHIGDSRIYMVRGNHIRQLTDDHTVANELVKGGRLKLEDVPNSRYRNVISRCMGYFEYVEPEILAVELQARDRFLICSDGLHDYFGADELLPKLNEGTPKEIASTLIQMARTAGGKDNITAIILEVGEDRARSQPGITPNKKLEILSKLPLFAYLSYRQLATVAAITRLVQFDAGQTVFDEGDDSDCMYVVLKGVLETSQNGTVISIHGQAQSVGEMGVFSSAPRSATAVARGKILALAIERSGLFELLRSDPVISSKILWNVMQDLSAKLRETTRAMTHQVQTEPTKPQLPFSL